MKVSVIVPVYNAEDTLRRCLDSIIEQSYSNIEIILVNDGSTDTSLKICEEYSRKDNRIIIISQKNGGPGIAKNHGLEIATGEYVCFVDSDDRLSQTGVELLLDVIIREKAELGISGYTEIYVNSCRENNIKIPNVLDINKGDVKELYQHLYRGGFINSPWAKLYSMKIIRENGIKFDSVMRCEDIPFNMTYYKFINKIAFVRESCYEYTITGKYCEKLPIDYYNVWEKIVTMMKEIKHITDINFRNEILMQHLYICLKTNYLGCWSKSKKDQAKYTNDLLAHKSVQEILKGNYRRREHIILKYLLKLKNEKLLRITFITVNKVKKV